MGNPVEDYSQLDLSREEMDKLVAEVTRYVIFKYHQSSGCPIKRDELTHIVTKSYRQRALPASVIEEARKKLSDVFGYEMKELQRSADVKSYVITSKVPDDMYRKHVEDESTAHLNGLAFVVISVVHLAGGKISQENLWHHLKRMGLQEDDESHPVFGNTKLSLEALVQQRYLQKNIVNGPEGNTVMFGLAERALDGPINQKIKEHILKIVNPEVAVVDID